MAKKQPTNGDVYDWYEELNVKRRNLYSNIVLIESDDTRRYLELVNERPAVAKKSKGKEKWYALDPLNGLREVVLIGNEISYEPRSDINIQQFGFSSIFPTVSDALKKGDSVVVITNLIKTDDAFNTTLLGWATDNVLMDNDSTVLMIVNDRSIFPNEVISKMNIMHLKRSTEFERRQLISAAQENMKVDEELEDEELDDATRITAGMNLEQVEASAVESILVHNKIDLQSLSATKIRILSTDPTVEIIHQPKFGFEAVGGYDALKQRIIDDIVLPLKNPDYADIFDMAPPRGILLYGPPGTGKTLLVKSMAKELNMSILLLRLEHILGKYVGESEKSMRRVFDIADSMAPCILFVDEFDRFSKRGTTDQAGSHVERELFSMLLEKLGDEDRQWFFAAATNIIETIDPALMRTGRIDSVAPVPFPDEAARKQIFNIHTTVKRKLPLAKGINADEIAKKTYMWSGSDIEALVIRTANCVMKEAIKSSDMTMKISMKDFETIYETFNVNVDHNIKLQNKMKDDAKRYSNDKRLDNVFEQAQKVMVSARTQKAAKMQRED